ncbi:MAG: TonB-dependent receptor [Bacteroidota bacterium]
MKIRNYTFVLSLLVAFPIFLYAQDGKLRGKVLDKETGESLLGASVALEGTTLGASTDVNGEYVILSVPPGDYTVKVNYIGYAQFTISGVRVNANMTTTRDISLSSSSVQMQDVVVVAERALIQRNTTNTVRVTTSDNIKNIPIRGIQNIIALEAGVVQQGGKLYVRGGRAGEVAYIVDGANATSPISNTQTVGIIQEAIEEFQLQAGGYTAEFGGANAGSGIVRTTVKTGGSKYKLSADYQSDGMESSANSFGNNNAVLTLGGPIGGGLSFFVAGQYNYTDNRQKIFLTPFEFKNFKQDGLGSGYAEGTLLPKSPWANDSGTVALKENTLPMNWQKSTQLQGTLLYDANPIKVRFTGSYNSSSNPTGGSWPSFLPNYFLNEKRYMMSENNTLFGNLRLTHLLSSNSFYEVGLSVQNISAKSYDQDFKDEWLKYADSSAHAGIYNYTDSLTKGYFVNRYQGPYAYSTIFQFNFNHPNAPNNSYSLSNQSSIGGTFDYTSQLTNNMEVKFGGGFESWTYRSWSIGSISSYLLFRDANKDGNIDAAFTNYSDYEQRVRGMRAGGISSIGYKWNDPTVEDDETNKPGKPFFANGYGQYKYESSDLIVNLGLRYEYYAPNGEKLVATVNPATGLLDYQYPNMDDTLKVVKPEGKEEMEPYTIILPRVSFSFPVTENTVFYAMYGKYAQMPSLDQLYISDITMSSLVNPTTRTPYNLFGTTLGFTLKPERNTQYEVGIRQTLTDNFALTVSGFYKDMRDQLTIRRVYNSVGTPITTSLQNQDFGTVKGVEVTLELRRTNRLAAKANYTLSDARGTGSNARSSNNGVTDEATARFPNFITPLDYNQTHRGSILVDYRFAKGDGDMLEGFGMNAILSFNSGHAYTKIREPRNLGQASPWNIGVRSSIDTRSRNPVEPVNSSTTPWVFNVDLNLSKMFYFDDLNVEVYANLLNALNTKQVINVYPTTGTANDDGWLKSPFAESYKAIDNYENFYRATNLDNRYWALQARTFGTDVYGAPREVRFGVRLEY